MGSMSGYARPRIGSLFTGTGGLDMATRAVLGGEVVWHSEIDPAACDLLAYHYPSVPNIGNITAIDWDAMKRAGKRGDAKGKLSDIDVMTGGFP